MSVWWPLTYLALDLLHFILVRCYRSLQLDLYIIYVYFATTVVFLAPCTECNPADLGSNQTSLRGQGMVNVSNRLIHYSGVSPDSIATLQCNDGYRADSFLNRTCMFGGQWSEGVLECVIVDEGTGKSLSLHSLCIIDINFFPNAFHSRMKSIGKNI